LTRPVRPLTCPVRLFTCAVRPLTSSMGSWTSTGGSSPCAAGSSPCAANRSTFPSTVLSRFANLLTLTRAWFNRLGMIGRITHTKFVRPAHLTVSRMGIVFHVISRWDRRACQGRPNCRTFVHSARLRCEPAAARYCWPMARVKMMTRQGPAATIQPTLRRMLRNGACDRRAVLRLAAATTGPPSPEPGKHHLARPPLHRPASLTDAPDRSASIATS
jgi:hypothetical protein